MPGGAVAVGCSSGRWTPAARALLLRWRRLAATLARCRWCRRGLLTRAHTPGYTLLVVQPAVVPRLKGLAAGLMRIVLALVPLPTAERTVVVPALALDFSCLVVIDIERAPQLREILLDGGEILQRP